MRRQGSNILVPLADERRNDDPFKIFSLSSGVEMTFYNYRKAKKDDLRDIVFLLAQDEFGKEREIFTEEVGASYQNAFDQIDVDPNQYLMVVEVNGGIIGTCHLTFMPSLTFQGGLRMNIEGVRVVNSYRGQGVGKWMIKQAIIIGRERGCKIIQLTTNKKRIDAIRFYEELGFQATHEGMKMYL